jgi:ribonuclease HI
VEQWGQRKSLRDKADRFSWTVSRKIFGIGKETPVRAISSLLGLEPVEVVWESRRAGLDLREELNGVLRPFGARYKSRSESKGRILLGPRNTDCEGVGMKVGPTRPKEEAERWAKNRFLNADDKTVFAYTDGSCRHLKAAAAVVFADSSGIIDESTETCPYHVSASDAEFLAIILALERLRNFVGFDKAIIFSDSRLALDEARSSTSTSPLAHFNRRFSEGISNLHLDVEAHWLPGHRGITGNTLADELARKALTEFSQLRGDRYSPMAAKEIITRGRQEHW